MTRADAAMVTFNQEQDRSEIQNFWTLLSRPNTFCYNLQGMGEGRKGGNMQLQVTVE